MVASSITPNPPVRNAIACDSISTRDQNPSARVMSVSLTGSSFAVNDYKQYYLDLKQANAAAQLAFKTQYRYAGDV
jgi:hypothetical protein